MKKYLALILTIFLSATLLYPQRTVHRGKRSGVAIEPLLNGLVASWKLSNLSDAIGSNTLTNNNTATFNTGHIGNAVYTASASSQYLSIASNASLQMGDIDFTVAIWIWADSAATMVTLVKGGVSAGQSEYVIYYTGASNNKINAGVYTATDVFHAVATTGTITTSTWNLVIIWHDATANTINIKLNNAATDSAGTGGALQAASNGAFELGRNADGTLYWDGRQDNVNVWKRLLTGGEFTRLWNGGAGCEHPFSACP